MSGYYRDPNRQNQYNRYTYAREGQLPNGTHGGRPMSIPVKQLVARGTPQYGQLPPIEGDNALKKTADKVKRLVTEGIKIEALQAGITGSWGPGFDRDDVRPETSGKQVPTMGEPNVDYKAKRRAYDGPRPVSEATGAPVAGAKMPNVKEPEDGPVPAWLDPKNRPTGKPVDPLFGGEKLGW